MDWTDMIFGKKTLADLAKQGSQPSQGPSQPANVDMAKMAQDQADTEKASQFTGAHQPTMQQLKGTGTKTCPTCGAAMSH